MKVSDNVKKAYQKDTLRKHISLYFPEISKEVSGVPIHQGSMSLSEKLVDKESIEFVGCIASKFKIRVQGLKENIKGKKVIVKIWTDGTEEEKITLFNGIVDSAVKQSNRTVKEITAYDELYTRGNVEAAAWYKSIKFPISLKDLRDSLFRFIGIEQENQSLPNDGVMIKKQYAPNTLQALAVIKAVCQINGACGIINRRGKFEYRILKKMGEQSRGAYPGLLLFPGSATFPGAVQGAGSDSKTAFQYYRNTRYEEFEVRPVDKVTIRQSEDDEGVTYGDGENNYIIQGNMFAYGLPEDVLNQIAENIYRNVSGFAYYPYTAENNGIPFAECGLDVVTYMMIDYEAMEADGEIKYETQSFPVLNRTLTGDQSLKDSYTARGEEYQTEFVTDLQTQIDTLKKKQSSGGVTQTDLEDYAYSRDEIDDKFSNFEGGGTANIVSVDEIPRNPQPGVLYIGKGMVIIE